MRPQAEPDAAVVLHHLAPVAHRHECYRRLDQLWQRLPPSIRRCRERQHAVGEALDLPERLPAIQTPVPGAASRHARRRPPS